MSMFEPDRTVDAGGAATEEVGDWIEEELAAAAPTPAKRVRKPLLTTEGRALLMDFTLVALMVLLIATIFLLGMLFQERYEVIRAIGPLASELAVRLP